MKFTETSYTSKKEILKFPDHYVNKAVTIDDKGINANSSGRKIVPAGTIIGGGFNNDPSKKAVVSNGAGAEGVLFYDVDVTDGPRPGAALIHGFINTNKLPEPPTQEAINALKLITFLK